MSNISACIHNPYSEGVHNSEISQETSVEKGRYELDDVKCSLENILLERETSNGGMNWAEVRNLWGQMALCMAKICLNEDGSINMGDCRTLHNFLKDLADETDEKIFLIPINKSPFCEVPGMEMIRVQALLVLDHMINGNEMDGIWIKQLNTSEKETVKLSHNGTNIVRALIGEVGDSNNSTIPNARAIGLLILKSLFTPHRQFGLPTCNMDAIIISETLNNPARLAKIFVNILSSDLRSEIKLAGGSMVNAQEIIDGKNIPGGSGFYMKVKVGEDFLQKEDTYKYLLAKDKIAFEKKHQETGIKPITITNEKASEVVTGLIVPVKDLNDVLLVNLMQNVYGEGGVVVTEGFVKSRELYFGISGNKGFMPPIKSTTKENRYFTRYHLTSPHPDLSQLGHTPYILCDNEAPEKKGSNFTISASILEDSNSSSNVANLSAKLSNQDITIPIEISKENLSKTEGIQFSIQVKVGDSQLGTPVHYFSTQEIQQLASWAEALKKNGVKVASTFFSQPEEQVQGNGAIKGYIKEGSSTHEVILDKIKGHVENLYLDSIISAPSALKEDGQWMIVGDRNWISKKEDRNFIYTVLHRKNEDKYVFTQASVLPSQKKFFPLLNQSDLAFGRTGQLCFYDTPSTSAPAPSTQSSSD